MAVEEQVAYNLYQPIDIALFTAMGQRLFILNRSVARLGFWLMRVDPGAIWGDVFFEINRVSDDSVIASKEWGLLADVPDIATYLEVTFDTPAFINEEVRIYVRPTGANDTNYIGIYIQNADVKAAEVFCRFRVFTGAWEIVAGNDCAYRYTYTAVVAPTVTTDPATGIR